MQPHVALVPLLIVGVGQANWWVAFERSLFDQPLQFFVGQRMRGYVAKFGRMVEMPDIHVAYKNFDFVIRQEDNLSYSRLAIRLDGDGFFEGFLRPFAGDSIFMIAKR